MNKKILALSLCIVAVLTLAFGAFFAKSSQKKTATDAPVTPPASASNTVDTTAPLTTEEVNVLSTDSVTSSDITTMQASSENKISREQALDIALKSAGLSQEEVWDKDIELDFEKNLLVYEVSFEKDAAEYNYIIDAFSGEIVHSRNTIPDSAAVSSTKAATDPTAFENKISREQALDIALKSAGLSQEEAWDKETELDYKKGILVYEVSFEKDYTDYEYIINAHSGEIIQREVEPY